MESTNPSSKSGPGALARLRAALGRLPLYPFEWICLLLTAGSIGFLRSRGMRLDWKTVEYTLYPLLRSLGWPLVLGIALQVLMHLVQRKSLSGYFSVIRKWRWWGLWLRLWVTYMALVYTYFWVKVCVPLLRTDLYDPLLWRLDRTLHFGFSPSVFATALFEGSTLAGGLDRWYELWTTTVMVMIAYFTAGTDALLRRRFMLSCVFLWGVGCWIYVVVPAVGPVFYVPELWKEIASRMPGASAAQNVLWANYQKILAGRSGVLREFNPVYAIAAMPSLHVGAHALLTAWSWRHARPFALVFLIGTFLTFLGSLVSGWHYALDGYVGLLLAVASYRLALLCEREGSAAPIPLP